MKKINVALVGLGFGGAFLPIYREHPQVGKVKIFDINTALQDHFLKEVGADGCYSSSACQRTHAFKEREHGFSSKIGETGRKSKRKWSAPHSNLPAFSGSWQPI